MKAQKFSLNLVPGGVPVYVHCDQRDDARTFAATIYDGNELYVFDGTETVTLEGTAADGHEFEPVTASASGSVVTFSVNAEITNAPGDAVCNLVLSKTGIRIGTENFILKVQKSASPNADIYD